MKIRNLARARRRAGAKSLHDLLASLRKTGGYKQLMKFIYNTTGGINGYDRFGHFLRAGLEITQRSCTTLSPTPLYHEWCTGALGRRRARPAPAAARRVRTGPSPERPRTAGPAAGLTGVPLDAQGDARGQPRARNAGQAASKPHAPSLSATKDLLQHDHRQARPRQQRRDAVRRLHHSESGAGTMRRGGVGAIASSPVMVGAVTTLIVILAVFLAYNANNGLPFVPSYRISVQVPNAETLVPGNDVRIGGRSRGVRRGRGAGAAQGRPSPPRRPT